MAFLQCDFYSEALGMSTSMHVILPQKTRSQIGLKGRVGDGKHPVLWLLHGRSDDHTIWMRRTSIERYVAPLGLAVVMPFANVSFYHNMAGGGAYGDFIDEELPEIARSFFPLSDRREDNFVAGLSMGGYGAMKLALKYPERYAAAASLSGALDAVEFLNSEEPGRISWLRQIFGDDYTAIAGGPADLLAQLEFAKAREGDLPKLFACCGREDFLLHHNHAFVEKAKSLNIPLDYIENTGSHEWGYWDQMIQTVLDWLPLQREGLSQ